MAKRNRWDSYIRPTCSVEDCGEARYAKGLCRQHYDLRRRPSNNQPKGPRPKRPTVVFGGHRYTLRVDGGYWSRRTGSKAKGTSETHLLHRDVWESAHGPLPDGMEVHHIDEDPSNNDLSNLQALTPSDHQRIHAEMRRSR